MADSSNKQLEQVFLVQEILPDTTEFFEEEPQEIEAAIGDADIVLDTNVLLIPFGAGAASLIEIVKVYSEIKGRKRLYVLAQVAGEFVKNRPSKLAQRLASSPK
ncbi:hypothetical protein [Sedimenticola hydrogenitrophicus]|uniref:hypothetical protein n=1 Tax=Sedimenticola hydrogenitrophicus TaxID=2967975 RepID=UPI0023B1D3E6|nr:hypothetical protein [Sedimenticola hydrogenitrophicus]